MDKFCLLYTEVMTSKDPEDMVIAMHMLKKAVHHLAELNLRGAKELVECFEGTLKYYNFLTEVEAEEILSKFVNQDGSRGAKWKDPEEFFRKVEEIGGRIDCTPHYNKWALYVAMNKAYSDQHSLIVKWVGDDKVKYMEACHDLALTDLKDKDRPCWIRPYFGLSDEV